jgi:PII-like signaling protein
MKLEGPGKALIVCVDETDHRDGKPLYVAIVERAREEGLAGATVLRGMMGFGANSTIHTSHVLLLSEDLPITILIMDSEDRIEKFLPILDGMVAEGVVATWPIQIELYRHGPEIG